MALPRPGTFLNLAGLTQIWDRVRESLWFVSGLMALGAALLAAGTPWLDRVLPNEWLRDLPLVFAGRPEGARTVLSTIATSMITIAGVVFSMTIVSLQLASSQFGPRLLRTFIRDRATQAVLGTFIATFLYCLLVLPVIDAREDAMFVPHVAVTLAVVLAIASLATLVYFIDHVAQSIHADAVIEAVGRELERTIDFLFPEEIGQAAPADEDAEVPDGAPLIVTANRCGYLRFVNGETLLDRAQAGDMFVRIDLRPGRFVLPGEALASVWSAERPGDDVLETIRDSFALGPHRTTLQDALFAFDQLTEMAVRALSPGINDPNTARHCLNRIGAGLTRLLTRAVPSGVRRDDAGTVRVLAPPIRFVEVLDAALDPLARNATVHLALWVEMLGLLERVAALASDTERRDLLRERAREIAARARDAVAEPDRPRIAAAARWADEP